MGVVWHETRFLVIRRSRFVEVPRAYCFPGGAVEPGESAPETVRRELWEELGVQARPLRPLWHSVTSWNVELAWWLTALESYDTLNPVPEEVEQVLWLSDQQMWALPGLLESNREFLEAGRRGEWQLGGDA